MIERVNEKEREKEKERERRRSKREREGRKKEGGKEGEGEKKAHKAGSLIYSSLELYCWGRIESPGWSYWKAGSQKSGLLCPDAPRKGAVLTWVQIEDGIQCSSVAQS